jgi:hypothetical protein
MATYHARLRSLEGEAYLRHPKNENPARVRARAGLREPSLMSAIVEGWKAPPRQHAGAPEVPLSRHLHALAKIPTTPSHERSGLRSPPALASSMILMAVAYLTPSSVSSHHHCSVAENRRTKSGFSFANGDCITHMRQGFPLQRAFAVPLRSKLLRYRCAVSAQRRLPPRHGQLRGQGVLLRHGRCRCDDLQYGNSIGA